MLRVSGKLVEIEADVSGLAEATVGHTGVPDAEDLMGWAEAVLARDPTRVARHRSRIVERLGLDAANDAAGVIATFHMVTRMADATGLPLDPGVEEFTAEIQESMGLARLRHS